MNSDERFEKYMELERQAKQTECQQSTGTPLGQAAGQGWCAQPTVEGLQNILTKNECSPSPVKIALTSHAAETLRCLFFHGPTWDGNVPSKTGRDELVSIGLAQRGNGWQWLTHAGIDACFANGIHVEKERRESREHLRRCRLEEAARQILS